MALDQADADLEKSINTPSFAQLVVLFDAPWDEVCPPGCQDSLLNSTELLPTMNPRPLSAGLLYSHSSQGLYMCLVLLGPGCRNWYQIYTDSPCSRSEPG